MSDLRLIDLELMVMKSPAFSTIVTLTQWLSVTLTVAVRIRPVTLSLTLQWHTWLSFAFFISVTVKETGKDKENVFGGLQHFHIDDIYDCELRITFYTYKLFSPALDVW